MGTFCSAQSIAANACTPGKYCVSAGLETETADCDAGYYCISGATVSNPTDGVTGNLAIYL